MTWSDSPGPDPAMAPETLTERIAAANARWGHDDMADAANLGAGMRCGDLWTDERLQKAEAWLSARANERMLNRDEPKNLPPAFDGVDDRQAVLDAIENLRDEAIQCAIDECANSGRHDPDYSRADVAEAELLKAIDDLLTRRLAQSLPAPTPAVEKINIAANGLTVEHRPGDRWSISL